MKLIKPAITLTFAATLLLTACGGNEYGQENNENDGNNIRQIGYNENTDNPMNDQANKRNRQGPSGNLKENNRANDGSMYGGNNDKSDANNADRENDKTNNKNEYEVANDVADRIESDNSDIDNVYVLTTENNAYVAAGWDKDEDLDKKTKENITKTVKSEQNDIDNVYISTNPDFVDMANQYADDIDNGEPIEGFFGRIGNMIERVFPDKD